MQLRVGARLRSTLDTTEVVIIKATREDAVLTCGGAPMVALDASPSGVPVSLAGRGAGTELGKRYTDVDSSLEVLCTKAGPGRLCVDGDPLQLKQAKSLPASD
jgi:hypothetical protein